MTGAVLVGPRGAGKSTVGPLAAALLGLPFVDADAELERRAGRSIAQIFASEGEDGFRLLEREVVLELLREPAAVLATGGGCVLDGEVRAALVRSPRVVWLDAPAEVLAERVRGSGRPALLGGDAAEEMARVVAVRRPLYGACSGVRLDTGLLSPLEAAAAVADLCRTGAPREEHR